MIPPLITTETESSVNPISPSEAQTLHFCIRDSISPRRKSEKVTLVTAEVVIWKEVRRIQAETINQKPRDDPRSKKRFEKGAKSAPESAPLSTLSSYLTHPIAINRFKLSFNHFSCLGTIYPSKKSHFPS